MRKIFKKVVTAVASLAMMAGLVAGMPTMEAKAAENVKLYFKVADATQYGVNVWGGATATGGADANTWSNGDGTYQTGPSLIADGSDWGYVTIDDTSKVQGLQVVKSGTALEAGGNNNIWNATIAALGLNEAYFDSASGKWYKEKACTNEVVAPTLDDIYYVLGDTGLTGADWGNGTEGTTPETGKMAEGADGVFTKTFVGVAKGEYQFKVLQDPADFGWDHAYVTDPANEHGNGFVTVAADNSKVTITIDKTTKKVKATSVAPSGEVAEQPTTPAPTPTPAPAAAHNVTVKVKVAAGWEKAYLYVWAEGSEGVVAWPGVEMTKDGDVYTYTLEDVDVSAYNMIINNGDGEQTVDIVGLDVTGDTVEITVTADKNEDGKYVATSSQQTAAPTPAPTTAPTTADATPVAAAVAAVVLMGLAVVVLNTKKANR
jgi:hypothetical protein